MHTVTVHATSLLRHTGDRSGCYDSNHTMRLALRSFCVPKYVRILKAGHHFLNSISQLSMTLVGTTIRCGPHTPAAQYQLRSRKQGDIMHTVSLYHVPATSLQYRLVRTLNKQAQANADLSHRPGEREVIWSGWSFRGPSRQRGCH